MIKGFKVKDLTKHVDERGFFTEIMREDWKELLGKDRIVQFNLPHSARRGKANTTWIRLASFRQAMLKPTPNMFYPTL